MSEDQGEKKKNGAFVGIIVILLLGLAFMAYLWADKNSQCNECENKVKTLEADMQGMNEMMSGYVGDMKNDLKADLQSMLETYDALKDKDQESADSIEQQQQRIRDLMQEVESGKKTAHQLFLLRKENESLRRIMKGYVVKIDSLNTLNLQLTTDLGTTQSALDKTTTELGEAQDNVDNLEQQVKKGAKLQAFNFSSTGLKEKLNSTTTTTNRARNTIQIKSSFTISENSLTTPGKKTVYMQIVTPQGKTLQSSSANILQSENGAVPYSDKKTIDYDNQRIDLAIYYRLNGEKLVKGNYKVKIYCQGQLIGSDNFTLK